MNDSGDHDLVKLFTESLQSVLPSNFMSELIKIEGNYLFVEGYKHKLLKKLKIIAFGKASSTMLDAFIDAVGEKYINDALLVTHMESEHLASKYGTKIKIYNSTHPEISKNSLEAGKAIFEFARSCTDEDLVVVLISGGGSVMMVHPEDGITFNQKSEYLNALLLEGIGEREVNVVRKALSKIKGGKLAAELYPAKIINLILSDEREHKINAISSGPTIQPDSTESAIEILQENMLWDETPAYIKKCIKSNYKNETVSRVNIWSRIIASREKMIDELKKLSGKYKYNSVHVLSPLFPSDFDLSVKKLVESYTDIYKECEKGKSLIVGMGEIPVKAIKGGKGGRNQHLVAAIMRKLYSIPEFSFAALATDGRDYIKGCWGAWVDNKIVSYAEKLKLDIDSYLDNTDTYCLHEQLGTLVHGEYTGTNVSDFYLFSFDK